MAQEEDIHKCSYSNIGDGGGGFSIGHTGRYSKKQKQKKVPQRGLGVAQLEKTRLEEQQKKDASIVLPSPPPVSPTRPSNLSLPLPGYQSYSWPILHPSGLSYPNSILKPQNVDVDSSNAVPLANSMGWLSVPFQVHANVRNSYQYNLKRESFGVDAELSFPSSLNFPHDSSPTWSLPTLIPRSQKHQVPSSPVSSSSSMMEPPSNQNFCVKCTRTWPEMAGMKRRYPFSLDIIPGPFHCKLPPTIHHISRSEDQKTPFGNRGTLDAITGNLSFRVGPSCSSSVLEPSSINVIKENGVASEFLTLAPPVPTLACLNSKFKLPSSCLAYHNFDTFTFGSVSHQANMEDTILGPDPTVSDQEQAYYSFLPPTAMQNGHTANTFGNCNTGELGENVDLNLRL